MAITSHYPKALKKFLNEKAEISAVWKRSLPIIYIQTKGIDLMGERKGEKDECGAHTYFPKFSDIDIERQGISNSAGEWAAVMLQNISKPRNWGLFTPAMLLHCTLLSGLPVVPISSSQAFLF